MPAGSCSRTRSRSGSRESKSTQTLKRKSSGASVLFCDVEGAQDSEGRAEGGKAKRKRTSAKDHAVLEAEYILNPKPNKAARAEIVQRVELSEKAVQVRTASMLTGLPVFWLQRVTPF